MTDGERRPPEPPRPSDAARPRPAPPTLDLKATEIASDAPEAARPVSDAPSPPSEAAGEGAQRSPSPEEISAAIEEWIRPDEPMRVRIDSGDRDPPPPPPPENGSAAFAAAPAPPPRSHFGRGVALGLIAALLGAAAALGTLWGLGQWSPQEDRASALAAHMATLEASVQRLADRPIPPPVSDQHIAAIAAKSVTVPPPAAPPSLDAVEQRLAKIESALAALSAAAPADAALGARVAALDASAATVAEDIAALRKRLDEVAASVQAAREAALRSSGAARDATAEISTALDTLKQRAAALESKAAQPPPEIDRAARTASAAAVLRDAVERGTPYAGELAAAKALAAAPAIFAPLEPFAEKGLPDAAALAAELRALALAQPGAPATNAPASVFDRLRAQAEKLVQVRPAGEPAASAPGSLLPAQQAASRGDLAGAVAALRTLPEATRAPAEAWIKRVEARQAALDFARKQARDAVAALAQQPK